MDGFVIPAPVTCIQVWRSGMDFDTLLATGSMA